ncbi:50S ribosomal protein L4 [Propionicicella superfundia]|uniref:50S ribosomal protein L4 n=1 Tax=Propionicicella superfundia TaxID=348582 RepID=UPI00040C90D8|nr:50S ribosomal protein L4 [Propionicicella superfundia]
MSSLTVKVLGTDNAAVTLPVEVFDAQTNVALIHQVVVAQLAAARQGSHATKTRGDVSGGGAKPWRQKGTGRARQGSRRAPQWTGGGVVHGPQPRDYAQRTPKKMIAAALAGALSDRVREGLVHVVKDFGVTDVPSTKTALQALSEVAEARLLVVLDRTEDVAWMSLRNVPSIHVLVVDQINAYDVLRADEVVFTQAALDTFLAGKGLAAEAGVLEVVESEPSPVSAESEPSPASAESAPSAASADDTDSEEDEK